MIQDRAHAASVDPGREALLDQLGDRRARHQHPLIDVERQAHEPHPFHEIGRGPALAHAPIEQRAHLALARNAHRFLVDLRRLRVIQAERVKHQRRRFVERVIGAVSVRQARALEARRTFLHEVRNVHCRRARGAGTFLAPRRLTRRCRAPPRTLSAAVFLALAKSRSHPANCKRTRRPLCNNRCPMKKPALVVIVLVLVAAAAGAWFASTLRTAAAPAPALKFGTALREPQPLPSAALTSHQGETVDTARLAGEWSLMFFGFTHCPDVCPTTLTLLGDVRKRMGPGAPRVVLVSLDPERDTPEAMAQYLQGFDTTIVGLTGTPAQIEAFAAALGIAHRKIPMGETYMVDHTAAVFAIDPQGRRAAVFTPPLDAAQIASDLELLAAHRG